MALIRPRLNDYHNLPFTQEEVSFAIPFLDEDIPLYLDPFLLWRSPSQQDNALHIALISAFNSLGYLSRCGKHNEAINTLIHTSECEEVGLADSRKRKGLRIGEKTARGVLALFDNVPQIAKGGLQHIEEIQLLVDGISKDRISDISCSILKSFLIDYTMDQCEKHSIPMKDFNTFTVYDVKKQRLIDDKRVKLPTNPETNDPIILVPKRWLRFVPWIAYDDYFSECYLKEVGKGDIQKTRVEILNYNRDNYGLVQSYIKYKERTQADCALDPLFRAIPVTSAKRKLASILKLPTGNAGGVDKQYEDFVYQLMASLLYPDLDFATDQSRTDSGVLIRDLLFYNNRSYDFLRDIYDTYGTRQIVMEINNVREIEREHVNQLNRYLNDQFGRFGILVTRKRLPKSIIKNLIDLWSGQRRCIIALTDEDINMMVSLFESKQRKPIDVIKKKYVEFVRMLPG